MSSGINVPHQQLSRDVVKVWTINETIGNVIGFSVLGVLFYLDSIYSWYEWIGLILGLVTVISAGSAIWEIFFHPKLKYKHWRYEADDEFLKLKFGAIKEEHLLIPMSKIQSVATRQGPVLRRYGLYALTIETIGSSHTIPALPEKKAFLLRDEIAIYAKVKEVTE
ncbi:MAG: PH domain-containing protein [Anaerobacillus sp.]